jgi:hypothetical protein
MCSARRELHFWKFWATTRVSVNKTTLPLSRLRVHILFNLILLSPLCRDMFGCVELIQFLDVTVQSDFRPLLPPHCVNVPHPPSIKSHILNIKHTQKLNTHTLNTLTCACVRGYCNFHELLFRVESACGEAISHWRRETRTRSSHRIGHQTN